jgi:RNA polymerase sigma factor (sigma-70 family)
MARGHLATLLAHLCRTTESAATADLTDRQLLEHFGQHGDQAAFEALVRRHGPLVSGVCWRILRQIEDAEDAFQATFLVLARKAGSGCWRESVGPWLHETARRVALRSKETAARRRLLENQQVANCQTSTPAKAACEELCGILDEELQRLPHAYKASLVLCYLEGRSQDQAARQLGWTLRTLQRRLEQARERLRARLVRRGVTLSAALLAGALTEEPALAALSSRLTTVTTRAAAAFASGSGAGGISAPVLALAQSTLRALALTHLKVGLSVVLVVAGLALAVLEPTREKTGKPIPA